MCMNAPQSASERLPPEVLSIIFQMSVPPFCYSTSQPRKPRSELFDQFIPLKLSAVCTAWRRVALSYPALWKKYVWSSALLGQQIHHILPLFLERSRGFLHLVLRFDTDPALANDRFAHPSVDHILLQYMPNIRALTLHQPPKRWFPELVRLSRLEEFELDYGWMPFERLRDGEYPHFQRLDLHKCTSLRRVSLSNTQYNYEFRFYCRLPRSLSTLHLSSIPVDSALMLVTRCPNLVELKLKYLMEHCPWDTSVPSWVGPPMKFGLLKVLVLDRRTEAVSAGDWMKEFLTHVELPALSKLTVVDHLQTASRASPAELAFFGRLTSIIHSLHLDSANDIQTTGYDQFFTAKSSIEQLCLSDFHYGAFLAIIRALASSTSKPMPQLRSLTVSGTNQFESDDDHYRPINVAVGPECLEVLADALERRLGVGETFCLNFEKAIVEWSYPLQERMRALVKRGVELELLEDGDAVDWLRD